MSSSTRYVRIQTDAGRETPLRKDTDPNSRTSVIQKGANRREPSERYGRKFKNVRDSERRELAGAKELPFIKGAKRIKYI